MNTSKLIWGVICLALAGVLVALTLTLPPDSLMFQIGDQNMPWVPAVVLGIVGIVLLATARVGEAEQPTAAAPPPLAQDAEKAALNKRLETVAWGLFLIALGGFMFVPHDIVARGLWSILVGGIMLGLNAARYFYKIRMSGFTTVLGILSVLGGIGALLGLSSLEGAFLLIILGAYLILKPWFDQHRLFGKAEESRPQDLLGGLAIVGFVLVAAWAILAGRRARPTAKPVKRPMAAQGEPARGATKL